MIYDFCVIGGGMVGLASAMKLLQRRPGASLVLIEKEDGLARHQTGHNCGVIHSGIYYQPGSLKANLCRRGAQETLVFAREHGIPADICGKYIVATDVVELKRLGALAERAAQNGIPVERVDATELRRREPNISALGALFVPSTCIVDYRRICEASAKVVLAAGGRSSPDRKWSRSKRADLPSRSKRRRRLSGRASCSCAPAYSRIGSPGWQA